MGTLITPLRRATQVGGNRTAVTCGNEQLTYAQTWDRCRRLVGALRALGLEEGDRVAVVGPNCHRYLELYQAVPGAGMIIVPLNPRHTVAELRYALEDSGAKILFTGVGDDGLRDTVDYVVDLGDGSAAAATSACPATPAATASTSCWRRSRWRRRFPSTRPRTWPCWPRPAARRRRPRP